MRFLVVKSLLIFFVLWKSNLACCTVIVNHENNRQKEKFPNLPKIEFEDTLLIAGKKCYFNIVFKENSNDYYMTITNGMVKVSDKKGKYKFMVIPKEKGIVKFSIFKKTISGPIRVMDKYLSAI